LEDLGHTNLGTEKCFHPIALFSSLKNLGIKRFPRGG
jgi:hypothetical protein